MENPVIRTSNKYSASKNVKFSRKCDECKKHYIGWGKKYCSRKCKGKDTPSLENSPFWKGINVTQRTRRVRAYKIYKKIPCEI